MARQRLFSGAGKERHVFLDERCLYPEFVPEGLPHRENELESIAYCFRPLLSGKKPMNVFLAGPTGVGKTVCAKYVLRELQDANDRAKSLYLNCFEFNSRSSVLTALANFAGAGIPRRGFGTDEIFSKLLEYMPKSGFTPIVILDEVDQLLASEENAKLLYDLLRVVEYGKQRVGVIMISNNISLTSKLDPRIRSSLAEQTVIFEPYTPGQLKSILSERAELAFGKGALEKDVVPVAAAHAAKLGGDCRIALESLLRAGRIAEARNSAKVSLDDLKSAFNDVDAASLTKGLKHLSAEQAALLKIVASGQPITSGGIYEACSRVFEGKLKERRLREMLTELEKKNFLSSRELKLGNAGNTREFSCRIPVDSLEKKAK